MAVIDCGDCTAPPVPRDTSRNALKGMQSRVTSVTFVLPGGLQSGQQMLVKLSDGLPDDFESDA